MSSKSSVVSAFTDEQASRLTGLSVGRLRYWDRTGFFSPSLAAENRRVAFSRVYTFNDLLSLQVLKKLLDDMHCSLQHLRDVKAELQKLDDGGWTSTTLFVLNKRVVFHDPSLDEFYEPVSNQKVFRIPLQIVHSNMKAAVEKLWERPEATIGHFERKRRVAYNAEVISGTRVTVQSIIDFIEAGYSDEEIVEEFPIIDIRDVRSVREKRAA